MSVIITGFIFSLQYALPKHCRTSSDTTTTTTRSTLTRTGGVRRSTTRRSNSRSFSEYAPALLVAAV
eukprot:5698445-Pyramimonas_sp.AAC.1